MGMAPYIFLPYDCSVSAYRLVTRQEDNWLQGMKKDATFEAFVLHASLEAAVAIIQALLPCRSTLCRQQYAQLSYPCLYL
jgi:hypothetical protein